ncbi:MAG: hypothetical protein V1685_02635 [Parcubacteria group bacterium]
MMTAKVICCYCRRNLGQKEVADIPGLPDPISHGICEECVEKIQAETEEIKRKGGKG